MTTTRILLLTTAHSYRAKSFMAAAERLGIEVVLAVDLPPELAATAGAVLGIEFRWPETAVPMILDYAAARPLSAIIPVDDSGVLLAAQASAALGLAHNQPVAAEAARDKLIMRQLLRDGGVPVPAFQAFSAADGMERVTAAVHDQIGYPCVVKPRTLNGSRGVIRANDEVELTAVVGRVKHLIYSIGTPGFLIEQFMPGFEVALEGVLVDGRLQPLAIFDKPDSLDGPYFEETIYVTPSCLPQAQQDEIVQMAERGARALGLQTGSVHAELRVNGAGVWIVEVNGRSIGGLCSQTLRFDMEMDGHRVSLEELILRQAVGLDVSHLQREQKASGVMMIPVPQAGILRGFDGVEQGEHLQGIDEIKITTPLNYRLRPLPEGDSYLGFIFAAGETPAEVEAALRQAHQCLSFKIDEELPVIQ
ncbi:MAG: ATP-grasp domain-containing protein [Chloroflexi bacterium]|nr:ATP-grasp domain-containing protein [Chloroflexota bacterium]